MNATLARLRRLLVMVPWLLENPGSDLDETAERFGVTPSQITDDIDVLGYCGLPGYGGGDLIEATISGGAVTVRMAEYFARPLRLTLREGLTLLLAARAARQGGLLGAGSELDGAVAKLETLLGSDATSPVALDLDAPGAEHLDTLSDAIGGERVVTITYRSASKAEVTTRDVEPWAVRYATGAWYLQGWCRLAGAPRDFRLDRIRSAQVRDDAPTHPRNDDPPPPVYRPDAADPAVVLDLEPTAWWVTEWVAADADERIGETTRRITFRVDTLDWAARLALRLGTAATVVSPPALRARVAQLAAAVLTRYDQR